MCACLENLDPMRQTGDTAIMVGIGDTERVGFAQRQIMYVFICGGAGDKEVLDCLLLVQPITSEIFSCFRCVRIITGQVVKKRKGNDGQ